MTIFENDPEADMLLRVLLVLALFCAWLIRRWWVEQRRMRP